MSALRLTGVALGLIGLLLVWGLRFRGRRLRNIDWLLGTSLSVALILLGLFPNSIDSFFSYFSLERGGGGRLIGLLILANFLAYGLIYSLLVRSANTEAELDRLVRELAKREFRRSSGGGSVPIYVLIPAFNEADNIGDVLARIPEEVQGLKTKPLVVVDGATDETEAVVRKLNQETITYTINRGGGSALRVGYEIAVEDRAEIIVTLDADGQHMPEEIPLLTAPIRDDQADLVIGSRVLGTYERDSQIRSAGVVFFNALISLLTLRRITDSSNGFRAIRTSKLAGLELSQSQFHTSELLLEALRHGLRVVEVPITVQQRSSGVSKKPPSLKYAWGYTKAILSTWLR